MYCGHIIIIIIIIVILYFNTCDIETKWHEYSEYLSLLLLPRRKLRFGWTQTKRSTEQ